MIDNPKPTIAKDQEEQLIILRDLTSRTGVLHDAQVFQLRMWPMVLFLHARAVDLHIDIEGKDITYVITKHKGKAPADMAQRFKAIDEWTKWLLGDEWTVKVKHLGKQIFRAGPNVKYE